MEKDSAYGSDGETSKNESSENPCQTREYKHQGGDKERDKTEKQANDNVSHASEVYNDDSPPAQEAQKHRPVPIITFEDKTYKITRHSCSAWDRFPLLTAALEYQCKELYPNVPLEVFLRLTTKDKTGHWFFKAEVEGWIKGEWKVLVTTDDLVTHSRETVLQTLANMMRGLKKQKLKSHVVKSSGSKEGKQLKEVQVNTWVRKRR